MSIGIDPGGIGEWLGTAKTTLDLLKTAATLVPKGKDKDELSASVAKAEQALARSDAALAKELGYQLCQCEFPPRIMLWRQHEGVFACPNPHCRSVKRPGGAAPAVAQPTKPINSAKQCPLCDAEMKVISEHPHPIFGDVGLKQHSMTCVCGHRTERDFQPGKGYR